MKIEVKNLRNPRNPKRGVIVFGTLLGDAEEQWPGRNQLLIALSQHTPVVFLESSRHRRFPMTTIERLASTIYVARNAFPSLGSRIGRRLPQIAHLDASTLRLSLHRAGLETRLLWLTAADRRLAYGFSPSRTIYDCADPNFLPEKNDRFSRTESAIAKHAALTFSTAHALHARMLTFNPRSYLLPNATSIDFHPSSTASLSRPRELERRPSRVVGYLGTIDWRFASNYVEEAARANPGCTFAIVGRVNGDQERNVIALRSLPNVVMPGQVDYEAGRSWVASFDIGMIPFHPNPTNDAINPVKMYMYLIAGLPVVSTQVKECALNPLVRTERTPADFARAVRELIANPVALDRDERIAYGVSNTWDQRAREALSLLEENRIDL